LPSLSNEGAHTGDFRDRNQLDRNTPMFVLIVEGLGIRSILCTDYRPKGANLASFGLQNGEGVIYETR